MRRRKGLMKVRGYGAWWDQAARELLVRRRLPRSRRYGPFRTVPRPVPDVLYNQSVYNHLVAWIYGSGYVVYVAQGPRISHVPRTRYDDLRMMLGEMLQDYFDAYDASACDDSPMVMFSLYDYANAAKNKRKVALLALDETRSTCLRIDSSRYFNAYF